VGIDDMSFLIGINVTSFLLFMFDKGASKAGFSRISENVLCGVSLLGS
jgi:uncharacterized membrane protein YsdA (DUF1294 family)